MLSWHSGTKSANYIEKAGERKPRPAVWYFAMEVLPMKLKPMADNVLLQAIEAAETTASGIILATTNKEKPMIYEIVSVGPGPNDVEMTVKAGEKVVVGKFAGTDVTIDKVDYKFVKQDDILAVVTD